MKKTLTILLLFAMLLSCFVGCASKKPAAEEATTGAMVDDSTKPGTNAPTEQPTEAPTTEPGPEPSEPLPTIDPDPDVKSDVVPGITAELKANVDKAIANFDADTTNDPADFAVDAWDGTAADVDWFTQADVVAAKKYTITTAAAFVGFRTLINENTFEGWEITLGKNIDLANKPLAAITGSFEGTFDGKGYVISNISMVLSASQNGLFAKAGGNATFQNFGLVNGVYTINDGANCTQLGTVCGIATLVEGKVVSIYNVYSNVDIVRPEITKGSNNKIGGMLGEATGAGNVKIENCLYEGDLDMFPVDTLTYDKNQGAMLGGIIGYFNKTNKATVQGCIFNGSLDGGRMSGGILGAIIETSDQNFAINACVVNAKLNMNMQDANPYAGGIAGRISAKTFTLTNSSFNGEMTVLLGSSTPKQAAGGLVGVVFDSGDAQLPGAKAIISDCQVNGRVVLMVDAARAYNADVFVGSVEKEDAVVGKSNLTTGTDFVFGLLGKTKLKDAKYSLCFIATADSLQEGNVVGFDYSVYVNDDENGKIAKAENVRVFAELVTEIAFVDGVTYKASDFGKASFYVLDITDIEAKYSITGVNFEMTVTPFVATKAGDVVTITDSYTVQYGGIVVSTPAA